MAEAFVLEYRRLGMTMVLLFLDSPYSLSALRSRMLGGEAGQGGL